MRAYVHTPYVCCEGLSSGYPNVVAVVIQPLQQVTVQSVKLVNCLQNH